MTCPFKPRCINLSECNACKRMGHEEWCGSLCDHEDCGECTCPRGQRSAAHPHLDLPTGSPIQVSLWNTPTTSSGRFEEAKKSGDVFRGSRREDGGFWFWDSLDPLHKHLMFALALATTGLILHALGIFCS